MMKQKPKFNAVLLLILTSYVLSYSSGFQLAYEDIESFCDDFDRKNIDTVFSFLEEYKDGTIDTIIEEKWKFRNIDLSLIDEDYEIEILTNVARTKARILCNGPIKEKCNCKNINQSFIDTIKINYGPKRLVSRTKIGFDKEEIGKIQNRGFELFKNKCEPIYLTSEYRVIDIISNPSIKAMINGNKYSCGNDSIIVHRSVMMNMMQLNSGSKTYPKKGNFDNNLFIDPTKLITNDFEWKLKLENIYGFDTTINMRTKK